MACQYGIPVISARGIAAAKIRTLSPSARVTMKITDANGRVVRSIDASQGFANNQLEIDVSNWANGIYLISLEGEGFAPVTRKLTVLH